MAAALCLLTISEQRLQSERKVQQKDLKAPN